MMMATKMERLLRKKIDWQENQVCSQVAMMMKILELLLIARVSLCRLLAHSDGTFLYLRKTKYSKC